MRFKVESRQDNKGGRMPPVEPTGPPKMTPFERGEEGWSRCQEAGAPGVTPQGEATIVRGTDNLTGAGSCYGHGPKITQALETRYATRMSASDQDRTSAMS